MNQWLVFYAKNARIGSLPLTQQNLDGMKAQFCMSLIQTDVSGTQHWNVLSPWGRSPQGRMAHAEYARKYGQAALKELLAAK
jgi:hypothetical protein